LDLKSGGCGGIFSEAQADLTSIPVDPYSARILCRHQKETLNPTTLAVIAFT
jgi:hypothetical protein